MDDDELFLPLLKETTLYILPSQPKTNNKSPGLTVKMKKSSMNMAPNGRMPAINVLKQKRKHKECS